MDSGAPSKGKDEKDFTVKFKVFEHSDRSKGYSVLKLAKPYVEPGGSGIQDYPEVSIIRQSATNKHAVEIMCGMRHQNIISMKAVGPKSQDDFLIFIEKIDGSMGSILPYVVSEMNARIPSDKFRRIMIEVIEGVEFLRKKQTYHGNLNWTTTFYKGRFTVKLCGFRYHDSMDMEDAQWQDWMSIRQMLQDVSDIAVQINQDPEREVKLACDDVDALMN
ncbi:hypothetical protein C2845_PM01G22520 [Panicum miliaceum]|uniref:Protein kinase domain-containing protein n=1 Tax=Panicum miliaceum TaxID=4540 RepID=A0A3L6TNJ4_PANMI|nr:hypothetical protein C2845_PM01G22520 [Panicum miliaceum]